MGILRLAGTLAAAAVAFSGYAAYRRRQAWTDGSGVPRIAEPLQRWEGEGGAVPEVRPRRSLTADQPDPTPDEAGAGADEAALSADAVR